MIVSKKTPKILPALKSAEYTQLAAIQCFALSFFCLVCHNFPFALVPFNKDDVRVADEFNRLKIINRVYITILALNRLSVTSLATLSRYKP